MNPEPNLKIVYTVYVLNLNWEASWSHSRIDVFINAGAIDEIRDICVSWQKNLN